MRQVLPTKPFASAMRYGPFFAGHWKCFVFASQGLKQAGFSPGPATTLGGAARAAEVVSAATAAARQERNNMQVSSVVDGLRRFPNCSPRREGAYDVFSGCLWGRT